MEKTISIDTVYVPSEEVVARQVGGEFVLVPISAGVGDFEDAVFTLNEEGKAIWDRMDGKRTLREIALDLGTEYDTPIEEIQRDVIGFTEELFRRRILHQIPRQE
ncbi:MAG: PqqD family protein [Candidatus Omnitrophica bacterium]|nr:PqqD family protein [Candidatus Omnitrophota bacterium]